MTHGKSHVSLLALRRGAAIRFAVPFSILPQLSPQVVDFTSICDNGVFPGLLVLSLPAVVLPKQ